jgi:hypothetical protein
MSSCSFCSSNQAEKGSKELYQPSTSIASAEVFKVLRKHSSYIGEMMETIELAAGWTTGFVRSLSHFTRMVWWRRVSIEPKQLKFKYEFGNSTPGNCFNAFS